MIVVPETEDFRYLAKHYTSTSSNSVQSILEIGSSTGECSAVLLSSKLDTTKFIGVEVSRELMKSLCARFPGVDFRKLDFMANPLLLAELSNELRRREVSGDVVVYIDVGGCRDAGPVLALTENVLKALLPSLVVVKCRAMYAQLGGKSGSINDLPALRSAILSSYRPSKPRHPLKQPLRTNPDNVPICRFHNYSSDGCKKGLLCEFDHKRCHLCLQEGHTALLCTSHLSEITS